MARYARLSGEQNAQASRFDELHPDEQRILLDWIQRFFTPGRRPTMNRYVTAYGLKHIFGNSEFGFYVFSRELTSAMENVGFRSELTDWGDWHFNVAQPDVEAARKATREIEPVPFGSHNPAWGDVVSKFTSVGNLKPVGKHPV